MSREDLAAFLSVVPADQRTWQTFDDKRLANGVPRRTRRLARVLHGFLESVEPTLHWLNTPEVGAGVYITGNYTDGHGRATHNITRIAAMIADLDHGLPPNFPLAPALVVETSPGKFQAWWHLAGEDTLTCEEHRGIHERLVADYGADPRASGIARVYRVPGFWHLKREPFLVRIVGGTHRHSDRNLLLSAFPPVPPPALRDASLPRATMSSRATLVIGLDRFLAPLRAVPADDYATWITVGLALHAESGGGSDGLAMWDVWSAGSSKYRPGECAARWATFKSSGTSLATGGKIFWLAARHG